MTHYNYWCSECTCGKQGKERNFVIDAEKKDSEKQICPNSGLVDIKLKLMGESCTIATARFSGKLISKEEKVKALKKRAHDDYKKNIVERKEEMNKKALTKFKNL